jgi:streptogramin lyase
MNEPHSIAFDAAGDLFICDVKNHRIRRVEMKSGTISTFAGTGEKKLGTDGSKFAQNPLNGPRALDFDRAGNVWVALREGNAVFRLNRADGTLWHAAGIGGKPGFAGNGGPAKQAVLASPKGLSVGPTGTVFLADTESHTIRLIDVERTLREVTTVELVAGTGEKGDGPDGNPFRCKLARPHGVFVDRDGAVFIGDSENHRVRVIRPLLP